MKDRNFDTMKVNNFEELRGEARYLLYALVLH